MLTYTFSRREKALLLALAIIVLFLAWFVFVFQRTTNEINSLESEIATVDSQTTVASAQVKRMHAMQEAIEKYKEAGISPTPVPTFDNMTPLMTELNGIMGMTTAYTLEFDALDTETSEDYILRGVAITFNCPSMADAENVVRALAKGSYPCSIDSVNITDGSSGMLSRIMGANGAGVTAAAHITFFEKYPKATATSTTATTTTTTTTTTATATSK